MERIPFHVPPVEPEDIDAVLEVLRSGWITTGSRCREFEREFAAYLGGGVHAVAVNSCTAAIDFPSSVSAYFRFSRDCHQP